ncbi:hypothetical protein ZHAS_00020893 [Anopheles sinensis]|uniref:Uncharacterized protein n=1 Tax=Anopheles sinensis TaxID=74873 RepID=A0A084WQZ7_ANOSI|nr:hypothetical protein ZHAS_00020893 [Anopheles sinensis]
MAATTRDSNRLPTSATDHPVCCSATHLIAAARRLSRHNLTQFDRFLLAAQRRGTPMWDVSGQTSPHRDRSVIVGPERGIG